MLEGPRLLVVQVPRFVDPEPGRQARNSPARPPRGCSAVVALATLQSEPAHPINVLGALVAFATLLWYKLSISKQAAKGHAGGVTRAFHLPPQWQWATAWLLKAALAIFTTAGLRLFMLSQTVCE